MNPQTLDPNNAVQFFCRKVLHNIYWKQQHTLKFHLHLLLLQLKKMVRSKAAEMNLWTKVFWSYVWGGLFGKVFGGGNWQGLLWVVDGGVQRCVVGKSCSRFSLNSKFCTGWTSTTEVRRIAASFEISWVETCCGYLEKQSCREFSAVFWHMSRWKVMQSSDILFSIFFDFFFLLLLFTYFETYFVTFFSTNILTHFPAFLLIYFPSCI